MTANANQGFFGSLGNGIGQIGSGIGNAVGNVVGGVGNAVGNIGSGIGNAVGSLGSGIGNAFGGIGNGVGGAVGNITNGVGNAVGNIGNGVGGAVGSIGNGVGGAIGGFGNGVGGAIGGVGAGVAGNEAGGINVGPGNSLVENTGVKLSYNNYIEPPIVYPINQPPMDPMFTENVDYSIPENRIAFMETIQKKNIYDPDVYAVNPYDRATNFKRFHSCVDDMSYDSGIRGVGNNYRGLYDPGYRATAWNVPPTY